MPWRKRKRPTRAVPVPDGTSAESGNMNDLRGSFIINIQNDFLLFVHFFLPHFPSSGLARRDTIKELGPPPNNSTRSKWRETRNASNITRLPILSSSRGAGVSAGALPRDSVRQKS